MRCAHGLLDLARPALAAVVDDLLRLRDHHHLLVAVHGRLVLVPLDRGVEALARLLLGPAHLHLLHGPLLPVHELHALADLEAAIDDQLLEVSGGRIALHAALAVVPDLDDVEAPLLLVGALEVLQGLAALVVLARRVVQLRRRCVARPAAEPSRPFRDAGASIHDDLSADVAGLRRA